MSGHRLDQLLVQLNLARSREQAKELINQNKIQVRGVFRKLKPSDSFSETDQITRLDADIPEFVSRSGAKLWTAIEFAKLDLSGCVALDVGQSTGGFTESLLNKGAIKVIGIDVGHGQLSNKLKCDSRVICIEKTNFVDSTRIEEVAKEKFPAEGFDFICVDVSFISVKKILANVLRYLKIGGTALILIKPQFELGPGALNKKGIVKKDLDLEPLFEELRKIIKIQKCRYLNLFPSSILGKTGNQEYFLLLDKSDQ